ncbi:MAG: CRISPR-associated endonuclease Cas2 [Patescibacteria group bacterium]
MRIKLPFTEKFLWDLYNFKNKTGDVISKILPARGGLRLSDFNTFRSEWTNQNQKKREREKSRKKFTFLIYRLKRQGCLKTLKIKNNSAVMITRQGLDKILRINLKLINKKTRKDNKWQMVLFDIPEDKRRSRDLFRNQLKCLGYTGLQKSIWVCQYDTLQETKDLIERYNLKNWVELLLVNKIGLK